MQCFKIFFRRHPKDHERMTATINTKGALTKRTNEPRSLYLCFSKMPPPLSIDLKIFLFPLAPLRSKKIKKEPRQIAEVLKTLDFYSILHSHPHHLCIKYFHLYRSEQLFQTTFCCFLKLFQTSLKKFTLKRSNIIKK